MFTGIVQTQATVLSITQHNGIKRLVVSVAAQYLKQLDIGASISINGCCLTVVQYEVDLKDVVGQVHFEIIDETLRLTNLNVLEQGNKVNFERSMSFGTELGGHIVSGHIQTTGILSEIIHDKDNCRFFIEIESKWLKYIMVKGFISVNGASLTVGDVTEKGFYLHLIPETLEVTNLGTYPQYGLLNIEIDQQTYTIVETVERYMKRN